MNRWAGWANILVAGLWLAEFFLNLPLFPRISTLAPRMSMILSILFIATVLLMLLGGIGLVRGRRRALLLSGVGYIALGFAFHVYPQLWWLPRSLLLSIAAAYVPGLDNRVSMLLEWYPVVAMCWLGYVLIRTRNRSSSSRSRSTADV